MLFINSLRCSLFIQTPETVVANLAERDLTGAWSDPLLRYWHVWPMTPPQLQQENFKNASKKSHAFDPLLVSIRMLNSKSQGSKGVSPNKSATAMRACFLRLSRWQLFHGFWAPTKASSVQADVMSFFYWTSLILEISRSAPNNSPAKTGQELEVLTYHPLLLYMILYRYS